MDELIIYLAGKCKDEPDGGREWRNKIAKMLKVASQYLDNSCKVRIINPTDYFSYDEKRHKTNKQIKEFYLNKIRRSNLVICNLNGTDYSIGTAQEVQFARDHNIPVIGFGTENVYPWISEVDCEVTFDSMTEIVDYVRDYYMQ